MRKRVLSLILVLAMVFTLLPTTAMAATNSGSCGDNVTWTLKNGVLTISGTGKMADNSWIDLNKPGRNPSAIKSAIIGGGVTHIGSYSFSFDVNLASVIIPSSVTSIGKSAFSGCSSLTDVYYSGTKSEWDAISVESGNGYLITATIHYNYDYTKPSITLNRTELTFTSLNTSETLKATMYAGDATIVGSGWGCSDTSVVMVDQKGKVTALASGKATVHAVMQLDNGNVYTASCTVTVKSAFSGNCGDNVTWTLNKGVLTISGTGEMSYNTDEYEDGYLWGSADTSSVKSIIIKYGVTSIVHGAFYYFENLTSITIPSSVTSIGDHAFMHCSSLTSITIPSSVTSIGDNAFSWCDKLLNIEVEPENPYYASNKGVLYNGSMTELIACPGGKSSCDVPSFVTSIGNDAFYGCNELTNMIIPSSVTSIGYGAFQHCSRLTSITIPSSVTSIGTYTFYYCDKLTSISIPSSVTRIDDWAFSGCSELSDVYYGGTESEWKSISIGSGNKYLTSATIHYDYNAMPIENAHIDTVPVSCYQVKGYTGTNELSEDQKSDTMLSITFEIPKQYQYDHDYGRICLKDYDAEVPLAFPIDEPVQSDSDPGYISYSVTFTSLDPGRKLYLSFVGAPFLNTETGERVKTCWDKNVACLETPEILSKDVFGFKNFKTSVSTLDYWNLYPLLKAWGFSEGDSNNDPDAAGGVCAGMAGVAMMFDQGYISTDNFTNNRSSVSELKKTDRLKFSLKTVTDYIKTSYMISKCSAVTSQQKQNAGDLSGLYDAVKNYVDTGTSPVYVKISQNKEGTKNSHAIWACGLETYADYSDIIVYDCNFYNAAYRLRLYGSYPNFTGFEYMNKEYDEEYVYVSYVLNYDTRSYMAIVKVSSNIIPVAVAADDSSSETEYDLLITDNQGFIVSDGTTTVTNETYYSAEQDLVLPISTDYGVEQEENSNEEFWVKTGSAIAFTNDNDEAQSVLYATEYQGIDLSVPSNGELYIASDEEAQTLDAVMTVDETSEPTQIDGTYVIAIGDEIAEMQISGTVADTLSLSGDETSVDISGVESLTVVSTFGDETAETEVDVTEGTVNLKMEQVEEETYLVVSTDTDQDGTADSVESILLVPTVEATSATVTYLTDSHTNADFGEVAAQTVELGESGEAFVILPDAPANTGSWVYQFQGWSDGETLYQSGQRVSLTQDLTLTAQWKLYSINGDGVWNLSDAITLLNGLSGSLELAPEQKAISDLNQDGAVDNADVQAILALLRG